jgi:hypothetical protein
MKAKRLPAWLKAVILFNDVEEQIQYVFKYYNFSPVPKR